MSTNALMSLKDKNVPAAVISAIEACLIRGDLRQLTSEQRVVYYNHVCESVGLNPLTRPFDYIVLNGKEVLYARRDAADQLRKIHQVSISIKEQKELDGVYVVTVSAKDKSGKEDEDVGAVNTMGLKGEARANAVMKAITKAKRRVTLSICGMGLLDETEVSDIPGAMESMTNQKQADKTAAKTDALAKQLDAPQAPEKEPETVRPAKDPEVLPAAPWNPRTGPKEGRETKKAAPVKAAEPEVVPEPAEDLDAAPLFDEEPEAPPAPAKPAAADLRKAALNALRNAKDMPALEAAVAKINAYSKSGAFKLSEIPVADAKAFINEVKTLKEERKRDIQNA